MRAAHRAEAVGLPGNENTAEIGAVDLISVNGNKNTVTWKKSGTGSPKVANPGKDNKVTQAR